MPQLKTELAKILQFKMWLRVFVVATLLTILLAYSVKRALPEVEFDWITALAGSIVLCAFMMALIFGILWVIPPIIHVNPKGIARQHGESVRWRLRSDIRRVTIDTADPMRPLLRVESSLKAFEVGIASKISLAELVKFLEQTFPELSVEERR